MIRSSRIGLAHLALALFAIAIIVQAANVQLGQRKQWERSAERQQTTEREIPASRGDILDASGRVLAQSRESVRLEITPREVNSPSQLRKALEKLKIDRAIITRSLDTSVKNVTV